MKKILFFIGLCVLSLSFWAQAKVITAGTFVRDISVYETSTLTQRFEVIGKIKVEAPQQNQLLGKVKKLAQKNGGDAVLNYRVKSSLDSNGQTGGGLSTGKTDWPEAEGIVVKFVAEGEAAGINEITDKTQIPVLD